MRLHRMHRTYGATRLKWPNDIAFQQRNYDHLEMCMPVYIAWMNGHYAIKFQVNEKKQQRTKAQENPQPYLLLTFEYILPINTHTLLLVTQFDGCFLVLLVDFI